MNKLFAGVKSFVREEDAPTMVEYGLLIGCIAALVALSGHLLGQITGEFFRDASIIASIR